MRLLVHEPMNTRSTLASVIGWPAFSPMYSSARWAAARLSSLWKLSGSGTRPVIGRASSGLVPQVTCGSSLATSISMSRSKAASASEKKVFQ